MKKNINNKILKKLHLLQFFLFLLISTSLFAAPNSNGSTTNLNTASGWTPSEIPRLTQSCGAVDIVSYNKNSGSLLITNGNSIRVTSSAILTVSGDLNLGSSSSIVVEVDVIQWNSF
tara:strand:+ start:422 stop:772 length:351 start_codon:yes stop_codon:yes gene_type:complete